MDQDTHLPHSLGLMTPSAASVGVVFPRASPQMASHLVLWAFRGDGQFMFLFL